MSWTDERLQYELNHKNEPNSFRSKQWFKALSDEEKETLCNKFGITHEVLKKAGCKTIHNELVVDLLKLHFPNPKHWKSDLDVVQSSNFASLVNSLKNDINEDIYNIEILKKMLNLFEEKKYLKYKSNKNRVYTTVNAINSKYLAIKDEFETNEVKESFANVIKCHLNLLFIDLKMFRKNS